MKGIEGKVALVTGGGSGIGAACVERLAAEGAKVIAADINLEGAQKVVDKVKANGGEATAFRQDASSAEENKAAVEFAVATYGSLELAVNNAGIGGTGEAHGEMDIAKWDKVIGLNLSGVSYGTRYQIEQFLKQDNTSKCAIVNMASIHAEVAAPFNSAYTAAKHGVVGLTKNAAVEYGLKGIRVNAVGPAYIDTPLLSGLPDGMLDEIIARHPMGRLGRAEEVAALTVFLLSEEAQFITGSYHLIDGAYTAM